MITKQDLEEAIAECQGERNPNANTCIKLAAFLTLQRELFGKPVIPVTEQSFSPPPIEKVSTYGDSDFLMAVEGKPMDGVMSVMDELMESMKVLQPRIYDSVMRKIGNL